MFVMFFLEAPFYSRQTRKISHPHFGHLCSSLNRTLRLSSSGPIARAPSTLQLMTVAVSFGRSGAASVGFREGWFLGNGRAVCDLFLFAHVDL